MNRQVILSSRPTGIAQSENFEIQNSAIPNIKNGQFLVQNHFLSVEPAMRGWIADTNNYAAPIEIGSVMRAITVGKVTQSKCPQYPVGTIVTGWFGWQEYCAASPDMAIRSVKETDLPLSLTLGILGINGITAYLALTKVGRPETGDTVLVSTAAGAVGSAVGQIANILGCRTIGITGSDKKVKLCTENFGYEAAFNYKTEDLDQAIAKACPDGINVYYDNTAGGISDTVIKHITLNSRIVICGTAAISNWDNWPQGPRVERHLLVKRACMQGFVIFDHQDQYEDTITILADWVRQEKLTYREDITMGIESAPDAIAGLYRGDNVGKRIIRLI